MIILEFIAHFFRIYGVVSRDGPPSPGAAAGWATLGKAVSQRQCPFCLGEFWGRGSNRICGRFKCYLQSKKKSQQTINVK